MLLLSHVLHLVHLRVSLSVKDYMDSLQGTCILTEGIVAVAVATVGCQSAWSAHCRPHSARHLGCVTWHA